MHFSNIQNFLPLIVRPNKFPWQPSNIIHEECFKYIVSCRGRKETTNNHIKKNHNWKLFWKTRHCENGKWHLLFSASTFKCKQQCFLIQMILNLMPRGQMWKNSIYYVTGKAVTSCLYPTLYFMYFQLDSISYNSNLHKLLFHQTQMRRYKIFRNKEYIKKYNIIKFNYFLMSIQTTRHLTKLPVHYIINHWSGFKRLSGGKEQMTKQ